MVRRFKSDAQRKAVMSKINDRGSPTIKYRTPKRHLDLDVRAYELGNLRVSKGGNFERFLDNLIRYYRSDSKGSAVLRLNPSQREYIDMNLDSYELGNLEISEGGNFKNWLQNLIQFYMRDTGQDKEYMKDVKEQRVRVERRRKVERDIRPMLDRFKEMTASALDPEHVSGGGLTVTKDGELISMLHYKGTLMEKEALAVLRPALEKKGLKVYEEDLWYP
ncbi:hypothetical protein GQ472_01735 [archaeon]|nr:hypothetical protein [archaeon]